MNAPYQSATVRVIAVVVGVLLTGLGLWAFLAPLSFYDSLAVFPPYNQHFIHDVGAFQVGLGASLLLTQLWGDALLVVLAGTGIGASVHFASHLIDRSLGGRPSTDLPGLGFLALVLLTGAVLRYRQLASEG